MIYEIYTIEPSPKIYVPDQKPICEGRISLTEYGVARAFDKSGKNAIGQIVRANVESISEAGIVISGFEEIINNPFEAPKYRYQEWLLKCSQNALYEIYAQEPDPKKICLGKCSFTRDGQAFAKDKNNLVIAELSKARVNFIGADGIMVSGFEEVGHDKTEKPKYRYQEWWLRYENVEKIEIEQLLMI
jgi:hypothetical protein